MSAVEAVTPSSPPELSSSSTKSSSLRSSSLHAVDEFDDISHFEDISLSDSSRPLTQPEARRPPKPRQLLRTQTQPSPRPSLSPPIKREPSYGLRTSVTLNNHVRNVKEHHSPRGAWQRSNSSGPNAMANPALSMRRGPNPIRQLRPSASRSIGPGPLSARPRLEHVHSLPIPRAPSRSSTGRRRTAAEIEADFDDSDDELPDDAFISNVPITPGLQHTRSQSISPDRTPPKSNRNVMPKRAQSWDIAMSELSADVQELTTALESYHEQNLAQNGPTSNVPDRRQSRRASSFTAATSPPPAMSDNKRLKTFVLPPVQRGNIMIDPLPVSKEKEKHLTRTRPSWLPPKSKKEERKHLKEYQQMLSSFQEAERKKSVAVDQMEKGRAETDTTSLDLWQNQILPDWANVRSNAKTREAWWRGIPPQLRGRVWSKAIGNELHLTAASYNAALARGKAAEKRLQQSTVPGHDDEDDESQADMRKRRSLALLDADIANNAFAGFGLFQQGQQYHEQLRDLLLAYSAYREDTGHVRGTAGMGALLLLHLMPLPSPTIASALSPSTPNLLSRSASPCPPSPDPSKENTALNSNRSSTSSTATKTSSSSQKQEQQLVTAFIALANLLNRPLSLAFCLGDTSAKDRYYRQLDRMLEHKLPRLHQHLTRLTNPTSSPPSTNGTNNIRSPALSPETAGSQNAPRRPPRPLAWSDIYTPSCQSLLTSRLTPSEAARAWDVMVFEGDNAVIRAAVGVLGRLEGRLYGDPDEVRGVLGWKRSQEGRRGSAVKSPRLSPMGSPGLGVALGESEGMLGTGLSAAAPGERPRSAYGASLSDQREDLDIGGPEEMGRWMKWAGKEDKERVGTS
ncbi:MAG: hypothetical protein M1828_000070 [Chrysothrix sp. TS-e1954]|nr:MAG: hypothetical protein M1828_000070 [Chrysothrix sp. TS-e1954]